MNQYEILIFTGNYKIPSLHVILRQGDIKAELFARIG